MVEKVYSDAKVYWYKLEQSLNIPNGDICGVVEKYVLYEGTVSYENITKRG